MNINSSLKRPTWDERWKGSRLCTKITHTIIHGRNVRHINDVLADIEEAIAYWRYRWKDVDNQGRNEKGIRG